MPLFKSKEQKAKELADNAAKEWDQKILPLIVNSGGEGIRGGSAVSRYLSGGYDFADRLHQIYCDFGYPDQLDFNNFWNMYRRFGMAKIVADYYPELCWVDSPVIKGSDQFNSELDKLANKIPLWNRLKGLDKRQRVGSYAGVLIEVKDDMSLEKPMQAVNGGVDSIVNIKPIYEGQLIVNEFDSAGNPTMYQFQPRVNGSRNPNETEGTQIHPSRLIIWAEGADDGSIYGISSIECVYNDLMDLRKISGASAEGGYQNSRSIPIFKAPETFQAPIGDDKTKFDNQVEGWLNKWRKRLVVRGLEPIFNNVTIPNPKEAYQASLNNIAAGSQVSQAILAGQQTGVLAGDKDNRSTLVTANSRRQNFLTEGVSAFIDWMIEYRVLPASKYTVEWGDLLAMSESDKLDLAEKMAGINQKQFLSGGRQVYTEDEIRQAAGYEPEEEVDVGSEEIIDDEV